ncbi:YceI family protein [Parvularcula lutaonensis]|uniref:YceI family protein n=1 Tax=Parvularcula lutaonensis TaxID=491923 RepID=A0ABV7MCU9_9PROT|nr:YceI family protein [Parvularcula lutaonensis]GGY51722.1 hypothetical protein GCM10007148_20810 [Parvularcula lutaonensis]
MFRQNVAFTAFVLTLCACASMAPQKNAALAVETLEALPPQSYALQPDTARMGFQVRSFTPGGVKGEFEAFSGDVTIIDASAPEVSVRAVVDLDTIELGSEMYENIVKSEAWFDVAAHPQAIFEGVLTEWREGGIGSVDGQITIRGITQPAAFDISLSCDGVAACPQEAVGFGGEIEISRSSFGMKAFPGVVGDRVRLSISGELSAVAAERLAAAP